MNKKGFTIVEMLIASVVFSIVFGSAIAVMVYSIKIQRYNLLHHQLLNQVSYATEYMARSLRMAVKDETGACTGSLDTSYNALGQSAAFLNYEGNCQRFYVSNGRLMVSIAGDPDLAGGVALTSSDFVTSLSFQELGDNLGEQPKVKFFMDLEATTLFDKPRIKIQTTVSQRNLNID